jgi:hypothetical protein
MVSDIIQVFFADGRLAGMVKVELENGKYPHAVTVDGIMYILTAGRYVESTAVTGTMIRDH